MRTYVIDELSEEIIEKIHNQLLEMMLQSALPGVYWLPIPEAQQTTLQIEHTKECGPYVMALEVNTDNVRLEFLVRGKHALHCSCVGYASPELEQHMMRYIDGLLEC